MIEENMLQISKYEADNASYNSTAEKLAEIERLDLPASMLTEEENALVKVRIVLEYLINFLKGDMNTSKTSMGGTRRYL